MYDESSPVAGLGPEMPPGMERTLTTILQPHA